MVKNCIERRHRQLLRTIGHQLGLESLESRLLLTSDLSLEAIHGPTGNLSFIETGLPTPPEYPSEFTLFEDGTGQDLLESGLRDSEDEPSGQVSAQGVNIKGSDRTQSFFIPPDTHGAVGPSHIVELINGSYAVFNKSDGTELDRSSLNQFWTDSGVAPNGSFDPRVVYDRSVSRFYAAAVNNARNDNQFLFAISETSNPLDGWLGFALDSDSDNGQRWADFPQLSFDDNSIHIGVNMFDIPGGASFATTRTTLVIAKADLLDAFPDISDRTLIEDHQNTTGFSAQGVEYNPDTTGGLPSVFFSQFNDNTVRLSTLSGPPTAASFSVFVDLNLAATDPPDADQPDASKQDIDTGNNRFSSQVYWRNNSYWAVQGLENGGDATIRFLEVTSAGTVVQNVTFGTAGDLDLYYPSIAVNNAEDVVIGFSYSSSSDHPSAGYITGTTAAGVTTFQTSPFNASAFGDAGYERLDSNGRNRWGDYSHTVVDPSDDSTFWTFQEYVDGEDNWATRITEIRVRSPELSGLSFNVVTEPLMPGDTVDIQYNIRNQGDGAAGGFWVDFFISKNTFISTTDFLLGFEFLGSLAAGATTGNLTETVTLPGLDDPFWDGFNSDSVYTIGMVVDRFDDQLESNESNNSNVAEFTDYDTLTITLPLPATLASAEGYAYFQHTGSSDELLSSNAFLDFNGDVDSFFFAGDTGWGGTYTINVGDFGNAVDPVAAVYDAITGQMIAIADNVGSIDDTELVVTLNALTRYVLAVADRQNDTTGDVSISISAPSSTTPQTIPVDGSGDGSIPGVINPAVDTDFYRFTAPANATGNLTVTVDPDVSMAAAISLYNGAGVELARDLVGGAGVPAALAIAGVSPGQTFFLSVLSQFYQTQDSFNVLVDFSTAALLGDFNNDGAYSCADVDLLVFEIASGGASPTFDLNSDTLVNLADLDVWLATAATFNGFGSPYKYGDADLNGTVDGSDFIVWNANKFTATGAWCRADFNADGDTDGLDFILWNANKFTNSDDAVFVATNPAPETAALVGESLVANRLPIVAEETSRDSQPAARAVSLERSTAPQFWFDQYAYEPDVDDESTGLGDPTDKWADGLIERIFAETIGQS